MPNKTHTTAVVLIPSESAQPPIQTIRRIHDRNFVRWMPHITLLYPFAERHNFADITPALAEAAQQVDSFSIELARFDAFKHRRSCTMFLVPEPADQIVRLHECSNAASARLQRHSTVCRWIPPTPLRWTIPTPFPPHRTTTPPN